MHRGPLPPVAWRSWCPRSVHRLLAASPCNGLSPSPSTISQSDCPGVIRSSSRCPLVRPFKPRLHPWALPCSHTIRCPHAVGTHPGSIAAASPSRLLGCCLPRRGRRVGCFTPVLFRGYLSRSLTFRPTCSLSTLRRVRYRTRRKTRYLTAGCALSGPPLQTAGLYALARRNPLRTARACSHACSSSLSKRPLQGAASPRSIPRNAPGCGRLDVTESDCSDYHPHPSCVARDGGHASPS